MRRPTRSATDPYEIDLPDSWTSRVDRDEARYENGRKTVRVTIREFSKNLSLYWWVDVFVRPPTAEQWTRCEVGVGDSYRDPNRATGAAQRIVDAIAYGQGLVDVITASDGGPDGAAMTGGG